MSRAAATSLRWQHRRKLGRLLRTTLVWGLFSIALSWLLLAGFIGLTTLGR